MLGWPFVRVASSLALLGLARSRRCARASPRLIAVVSGWPTFCTRTCAGLPPYRTISVVQAKRNCARTVGR